MCLGPGQAQRPWASGERMATGGADAKFCQAEWHRVAPCGIVWMRGLGVDHGRPTQQPELMSYLEYLEQSLPGKAKEQSTCHQPIHKWFPGAPYSHFHSISDFLPLRSLGIWEDRRHPQTWLVSFCPGDDEKARAGKGIQGIQGTSLCSHWNSHGASAYHQLQWL